MSLPAVPPKAIVRGPFLPEPVEVIITIPMGDSLKLVGRGVRSGMSYDPVLSSSQLAILEISPQREPLDGDPERFKLGIEAARLALAYEYDPFFALSVARIDPLPHQLEAVYEYFVKLPRIRFLLADDPGAGKTIMAGLLIKELKARGLVKRTLIVSPAKLCFQWQREMLDKFRERFDIVKGDVLRASYGQNPWNDRDQAITSISWVSRIEDARESLMRSRWDLIVVDEAHQMSAYSPSKKTLAYRLGEQLSGMTDHYLLMTATPHKGDPANFTLFLSLLDQDVYGDVRSLEEAMRRNSAPFYLRRTKEALISFPDPDTGVVKKLFTEREVLTTTFDLDGAEYEFYDALTRYVEDQSIRAASDENQARGRALGFTMAMLQRRFASSVYAVRRTLERMRYRRKQILADPRDYLRRQMDIPEDFDELPEDEQMEIIDAIEEAAINFDPTALREDILQLGKLIDQANELEGREVESKLVRLKKLLTDEQVFSDPTMKVLIFTEHKDTLDYLAGDGRDGRPYGKLREWGLTLTQIHGSMKIGDRDTPGTRIYAEREFREKAQVLVATEAAGEGINLQFCWFMINYDIPWNPVRLEQRMGRIHRYGQEHDCLIYNFVAVNTREGRVLNRLLLRLDEIRKELGIDQVFDVVGEIFPSNRLDHLFREMYQQRTNVPSIEARIVEEVNPERFRAITESALEGLAKRDLNMAVITGKSAEARERGLVPEVIEAFFLRASPLAGLLPQQVRKDSHVYRVGRIPRHLLPLGARQEERFGRLGREYARIVFEKALLAQDATHEWVTPGHPLFEVVREYVAGQTADDLRRGVVLHDLNTEEPYRLDLFAASIKDGRGRTIHRKIFVARTAMDGALSIRQPTLFADLMPAPAAEIPKAPGDSNLPGRDEIEHALVEQALQPLLEQVAAERGRELKTIRSHVEISLNELIHRQNLQLADLILRQQQPDAPSGLAGLTAQAEAHLDELNNRLETRRAELEQESHFTIGDIQRLGRAWVLPHPERCSPELAPMRYDAGIERLAVEVATRHEEERGCVVQSVELENRGFDLISRRPHPHDAASFTEVRFIEVKGRAGVGHVLLSRNEYHMAQRLGDEYWLYVVYDCAAEPELHTIQNPAHLGWLPLGQVAHYQIDAPTVVAEAERQRAPRGAAQQAFQEYWDSRLAELGTYNILVEGLTDKLYLELAAERYRQAHGVDLLEGGAVRVLAGRGTKRLGPDFGVLQSLEPQGFRFVVILDGDDAGAMAAEAMSRFGAQKNRHFFQLARADFKDKGGKSWDVEIEDLLSQELVEGFVQQHPQAVEERLQRRDVVKFVINGKPVDREGQTCDYKMMLAEYACQHATLDDLKPLVDLLIQARKCLSLES
ncbi:MAG: helicase-related protein [Chloroflexota bacterium]